MDQIGGTPGISIPGTFYSIVLRGKRGKGDQYVKYQAV